jgi:hypothetical protein
MPKNYTISDMQQYASYQGGKCLSDEFWDEAGNLKWKCEKGHVWEAPFQIIRQGGWCPACRKDLENNDRLENLKAIAREKGGECLTDKIIHRTPKIKLRCANGHTWEATYYAITHGAWCDACLREKARKKHVESVRKIAGDNGGEVLTDDFNSSSNIKIRCSAGHEWETTGTQIIRGLWCKECVKQRAQLQYFEPLKKMVQKKGGECLSAGYINSHTPMRFSCARGHEWEATYITMMRGSWCPECVKEQYAEKRLKELKQHAIDRGGKCLTKKYINDDIKILWECSKGHQWYAVGSQVINVGYWCPYCAGKHKTIDDFKKIAAERGGECLSDVYVKGRLKLQFKCAEGHRWFATATSVNQGSWCPYCSGRTRDLNDMHSIAAKWGGKCLSLQYTDCHTKLIWQCSKGHIFEEKPVYFQKGYWCPVCHQDNKEVKRNIVLNKYRTIALEKGGKLLSDKYINNKTKLLWECKSGHQWYATGDSIFNNGNWCPKCRGRVKTIEDMQAFAVQKGGKCLSKVYVNKYTNLEWQCSVGHRWQTTYASIARHNLWCPHCRSEKSSKFYFDTLLKLVKEKKGKCLSAEYMNSKTKMQFQCAEGHVWHTTSRNLLKGKWCPQCGIKSMVAKIKQQVKNKIPIETLYHIAEEKGGKCLSDVYENKTIKMEWQCSNGHIWKASAGTILANKWCPVCTYKRVGIKNRTGIEVLRQMAIERGGRLLSQEYKDNKSPLLWECKNAHQWYAAAGNVKNQKTWCPQCSRTRHKL